MSVAPNDPAVVTGLVNELSALIDGLGNYLNSWHEQVDAVVVRLQNAGASEEVPGVGHTGQVPPGTAVSESSEPAPDLSEQGVDTTPPSSTEPTGSSTGVLSDDVGSTPPEDTSITDYP